MKARSGVGGPGAGASEQQSPSSCQHVSLAGVPDRTPGLPARRCPGRHRGDAGPVRLRRSVCRASLAFHAVERRIANVVDSKQTIESVVNGANRIEDENERAKPFTLIAVSMTRVGQRANAQTAISGAVTAAAAIKETRKRVQASLRAGLALQKARHDRGTRLDFARGVASAIAEESASCHALALADTGYALTAGGLWASNHSL